MGRSTTAAPNGVTGTSGASRTFGATIQVWHVVSACQGGPPLRAREVLMNSPDVREMPAGGWPGGRLLWHGLLTVPLPPTEGLLPRWAPGDLRSADVARSGDRA